MLIDCQVTQADHQETMIDQVQTDHRVTQIVPSPQVETDFFITSASVFYKY